MTAEIIQFIPRANPDRTLALQPDPIAQMAVEIMNQVWPEDTAPSEMNPDKDSA